MSRLKINVCTRQPSPSLCPNARNLLGYYLHLLTMIRCFNEINQKVQLYISSNKSSVFDKMTSRFGIVLQSPCKKLAPFINCKEDVGGNNLVIVPRFKEKL